MRNCTSSEQLPASSNFRPFRESRNNNEDWLNQHQSNKHHHYRSHDSSHQENHCEKLHNTLGNR